MSSKKSSSKEEQSKVGRKQKPRGQQTGFSGNPDQNREAMKNTPALRGRRKAANKMFDDESAQQMGSDAAKPRSNTPSIPAAIPGVRCDRSTMTQNDLDNGRLVCLIGVAPLRPAEFVIFRIGQWTADRKS
jgi:hypothetical protein